MSTSVCVQCWSKTYILLILEHAFNRQYFFGACQMLTHFLSSLSFFCLFYHHPSLFNGYWLLHSLCLFFCLFSFLKFKSNHKKRNNLYPSIHGQFLNCNLLWKVLSDWGFRRPFKVYNLLIVWNNIEFKYF